MARLKFWVHQVLVALDQLFTALIGGWADETLSSYAWRMEREDKPWGRVWRPCIDWVFGEGHCYDAYIAERERLQTPPILRKR